MIDLKKTDNFGSTKIVSLAENTSKVSTIHLIVNLNHEMNPKDPVGQIKANIAQVQLLIPVPFVLRALVCYLATLNTGALSGSLWDQYSFCLIAFHTCTINIMLV